jgi:hypothetical protein
MKSTKGDLFMELEKNETLNNGGSKEELEKLFKEFYCKDVSNHTETKNNLTYLSWCWAWEEVLKADASATYNIQLFDNEIGEKVPYMKENGVGYMVCTSVTIKGLTRIMWLPVMDANNNALKDEAYTYKVKHYQNKRWDGKTYDTKNVDKCNMFDINKNIMRCLVKNIAMFGLGLYVYAGEDLPFSIDEPCTKEQLEKMVQLGVKTDNVCSAFKISSVQDLTYAQAEFVISKKQDAIDKENATKTTKKENKESK